MSAPASNRLRVLRNGLLAIGLLGGAMVLVAANGPVSAGGCEVARIGQLAIHKDDVEAARHLKALAPTPEQSERLLIDATVSFLLEDESRTQLDVPEALRAYDRVLIEAKREVGPDPMRWTHTAAARLAKERSRMGYVEGPCAVAHLAR